MTPPRDGQGALAVRVLLILAVAAALAPATAPGASAQTDPLHGCGPIEVIPFSGALTVAPGSSGILSVKLVNAGRLPGDLNLAIDVTGAGYSITPVAVNERIQEAGNRSFSFTVNAASDAEAIGAARITATLTCVNQPVRIAAQAAPSSVTLRTGDDSSGGLSTLGALLSQNSGAFLLIGGGFLVLGLAATLLAKKKGAQGLEVRADDAMKRMRPGRGTNFPIHVQNLGAENEHVRFEVGEVPRGWAAFMAATDLVLAANETRTLWLMVRSPPDAREGDRAEIEVTVFAGKDGSRSRSLRLVGEASELVQDE